MKHIISVLSIFGAVSISSQSLQCELVDSENIPVSFANIIEMTADSVIISGTVSDEDGNFKVMTGNDTVLFEISYIGSHEAVLPVSGENDLEVIKLEKEIIGLCPI